MRDARAFTLIELMMVIAILSVMIAIALPNFLEAQVRARVARVKADLRAIGVALESYAVDNGAYPDADAWSLTRHPTKVGLVSNEYSRAAMALLSTPVGYMTSSQLIDPFAVRVQESLEPGLAPEHPPFVFGYLSTKAAMEEVPGLGISSVRDALVPQSWISDFGDLFLAHHWLLQSVGPDRINFSRAGDSNGPDAQNFPNAFLALTGREVTHYIYDPTNGTVSAGDIAQSAKGPLS